MASTQNQFSPFPDILASIETKAGDAYGLQYAKGIWGQHTRNILAYNTQRQRDIINRQYREGLESIEKFKTRKGITNTSYLNIDYTPINIIAPTIDKIQGKLSAIPYKIQCNAIDSESKSRFDEYRRQMYADMFLKPYSDEIEKATGIPLVPKNKKIPESTEEAELHMKLNFKDDASIAMEECFDYVMYNNMFESSKDSIINDLLTLKRAAYQYYYDESRNIRAERIDVVDVITPYSKYDNYKNIPYIAVIKNYTIGELAVMNPSWTDEDIYNIAKSAQGKNNNPAWNWSVSYEGYYASSDFSTRPYYNFNIQTLEFYFLSIDKVKKEYKEHRKRKFVNNIKEDSELKEGSEIFAKNIENLYEGKWVIGTEYIFNYKKSTNIPREKISGSYSTKAKLPIKIVAPGIYDMQNKSHVERMIPHEDAIKLAEMGLQVMMIKAKPPGVAIDVRGLMDAAKGMGNSTSPLEIVKIYQETGNFIFSSITEENDIINSRVITELRGGIGDAVMSYLEIFRFHKNLINEVIGFNPDLDPTSAKASVGLGVQDNAIQSANNALKPLYNNFINLTEELFKDVALMIQDSIEYNNQAFIDGVGAYSTKAVEMGKKFSYAQMGIKIELLPDDMEKAELMGDIQLGIQQGLLNSSDAIRVRQAMKQNVKAAAQLLVFLEEKNRKDQQAMKQADIENNGQVQMQSAQAASEAQAQLDQVITQNKIAVMQAQFQMEMEAKKAEFEMQMQLQQLKNEGLYTVANINTGGKVEVQEAANRGKIVSQQVANEGAENKAYISHESEVQKSLLGHDNKKDQAKYAHESKIQQNTLNHDSKMEQANLMHRSKVQQSVLNHDSKMANSEQSNSYKKDK